MARLHNWVNDQCTKCEIIRELISIPDVFPFYKYYDGKEIKTKRPPCKFTPKRK